MIRVLMRTALLFATLVARAYAADLAGIWMGPIEGRNGEKQDMGLRFVESKTGTTGVLFGDEFDLPIEGLVVNGDHISFFVTNTDYRDRKQTKVVWEGTLSGDELVLTRERPPQTAGAAAPKVNAAPPAIRLRRIVR